MTLIGKAIWNGSRLCEVSRAVDFMGSPAEIPGHGIIMRSTTACIHMRAYHYPFETAAWSGRRAALATTERARRAHTGTAGPAGGCRYVGAFLERGRGVCVLCACEPRPAAPAGSHASHTVPPDTRTAYARASLARGRLLRKRRIRSLISFLDFTEIRVSQRRESRVSRRNESPLARRSRARDARPRD